MFDQMTQFLNEKPDFTSSKHLVLRDFRALGSLSGHPAAPQSHTSDIRNVLCHKE